MYVSYYPREVSESLIASLVVVMPIYNEEEMIASVVSEWRSCFEALGLSYQLLLLNDGSKDGTGDVLKRLEKEDAAHLVVVDKPNSGHGRSCRLGYDACVAAEKVEWILQIDSDGQCDPVYFKEFWEKREEADCVFGQRIHRDDGFARAVTSKICKLLSSLVMGRDLVDPNVPYRLMRREALKEALLKIPASFDIHNVAVLSVLKRNPALRWAYVPIRFRDRQGGSNSIDLLNVMHMGFSMLFDLRKLKKSLK
ncbi:glycosyltransferase family 2 protein [Kiritimatiellaeota bacterium B1221]|nr:glycosyltransferase family 2 protein [Kiritimatiellaeota bacterium B1221]